MVHETDRDTADVDPVIAGNEQHDHDDLPAMDTTSTVAVDAADDDAAAVAGADGGGAAAGGGSAMEVAGVVAV